MKRCDIAAMETSSTSGVISIIDAHKIFDEYKKLKKAIKKHRKSVVDYGCAQVSVDTELWEVLDDN